VFGAEDWYDAPLARRARRANRIALVCYLVPVTVATHWPRLAFQGSGTVDKFVHFVGFGVLAWLFLNAAFFRRPILNFALGVFWVYFDEVTQAIEILGRTFSGYDLLAGWLGCGIAGILWWSMRLRSPRGSDERLDDLVAERLIYADGRQWLRVGLVVAGFVAVFVVIPAAADGSLESTDFSLGRIVFPIGLGFLAGSSFATTGACTRSIARVSGSRIDAWTGSVESEGPAFRLADFAARLRAPLILGALLLYPAFWAVVGVERLAFGAAPTEEQQADVAGFLVLRPIFAVMLAFAGAVVAAGVMVRVRRARLGFHAQRRRP
jgi:hypothetical protein